jgi:FkbM family methyltransferase
MAPQDDARRLGGDGGRDGARGRVTPGRRATASGGGVTTVGHGEHFRAEGWFERVTARLRGDRRRPAPALLKRAHEFVLDHLPGDHLVSTLPGGERVRAAARYRQLSWNPEEYRAFRAAVRPGAVVLDVGANVGSYTLLFAIWVGPAGRVFAFEPAPEAREGLRKHVALNGLADRVEIAPYAASSIAGSARFRIDGASGANAIATGGDRGHAASIDVETTTIDAFCDRHRVRPDVVKIDVEGAELDVLAGARRVLAQPDMQAFVEFHPSVWAARGVTPDAIRAELIEQRLLAEPLHPSIDIWNTEGISVRLRRV